jgi:pimeloyl-ACP methyl ester carboxylesterase/predicted glycosyltransferase
MRARLPDREGYVERDGVRIHYEVHGAAGPTLLLLPAWTFFDSRLWQAMYASLARWFRVVQYDPRGSARSDTPAGWEAYTDAETTADAVAVLDATGSEQVIVCGISGGGSLALRLAADHPDRVLGVVAIAPALGVAVDSPLTLETWQGDFDESDVVTLFNRELWQTSEGFRRWIEWFALLNNLEPNSSWPIEEAITWSEEIPASSTIDHFDANLREAAWRTRDESLAMLARITCPTVVLQGTDDLTVPRENSERLAEVLGCELVVLEGAAHNLVGQHPVRVALEIRRFAERFASPPSPHRSWTRALTRQRRVLYLSSPIGLGHARRDLAVVDELRKLHPDLQVDWLTQHPVTALLEHHGERVHPMSRFLASESAHIEEEAGEHDLHCFQAVREMGPILANNFMVFHDLVEAEHYDLVVADEAWDVDQFLRENPELKRAPLAWLTDFDGILPMPDGGEHEAQIAAEHNAYVIEGIERFAWLRDRAVFIGNPDDIVPLAYGPDLPDIRSWVEDHYEFSGHVTGFAPIADRDRRPIRSELGYHDDQQIAIVTVGGSAVGSTLLGTLVETHHHLAKLAPDLHMVVVTGPRIDPRSITAPDDVDVVGYVPDLYRHLAVCDVAVVQGGLTTCMELTANKRPFLYFPLAHHFEQNFHVRHRLERYRAGRCMEYANETPESIAHAIAAELSREVDYLPVETDGATRVASSLAGLL